MELCAIRAVDRAPTWGARWKALSRAGATTYAPDVLLELKVEAANGKGNAGVADAALALSLVVAHRWPRAPKTPNPMTLEIDPVDAAALDGWRDRYRQELNCQIVHDSWHRRGFTQMYEFRNATGVVGYGALSASGDTMDTVKELYLEPRYRGDSLTMLQALVDATGAQLIEAQTNDPFLCPLVFDVATGLESATVLFTDCVATSHEVSGANVRPLTLGERDRVFAHTIEPVGDFGVEYDGEIVGTGGFFTHYNPPFGDVYMEVAPAFRRRGFGRLLIEEAKKACYAAGLVPAALTQNGFHCRCQFRPRWDAGSPVAAHPKKYADAVPAVLCGSDSCY